MTNYIKPAPVLKIKKDFLDAIQRLENGQPNNPKLKKLANKKRLKISIATVALEAGHSRTLIGHEKCRFPDIRLQIIDHKKPIVGVRDNIAVIGRLRSDVAELRLKLKNAQSETMAYFHAKEQAERKAKRHENACYRLLKKINEARQTEQKGNLPHVTTDPV